MRFDASLNADSVGADWHFYNGKTWISVRFFIDPNSSVRIVLPLDAAHELHSKLGSALVDQAYTQEEQE